MNYFQLCFRFAKAGKSVAKILHRVKCAFSGTENFGFRELPPRQGTETAGSSNTTPNTWPPPTEQIETLQRIGRLQMKKKLYIFNWNMYHCPKYSM